jgi:CheY-like chemotaxis protein
MMLAAGAETTFASSLEQAISLAAAQEFDGAVIDVNLHGQSSYPLVREILARGVAVIFATGHGLGSPGRPCACAHGRQALRHPLAARRLRRARLSSL